jgi:hypothetical protein
VHSKTGFNTITQDCLYPAIYTGDMYFTCMTRVAEASPMIFFKHDLDGRIIGDSGFVNRYYKQVSIDDTTYYRYNFYPSGNANMFMGDSAVYVGAGAIETKYKNNGVMINQRSSSISAIIKTNFDGEIPQSVLLKTDSSFCGNPRTYLQQSVNDNTLYGLFNERYFDGRDDIVGEEYNFNDYALVEYNYELDVVSNYKSIHLSKDYGLILNSLNKNTFGDYYCLAYNQAREIFIVTMSSDGIIKNIDTISDLPNYEGITSNFFYNGNYYLLLSSKQANNNVYQICKTSNFDGIHEPTMLLSSMLYPNPATDNTTITLELQQASQVHISLNDMLGREIKQIYNAFTEADDYSPLQITFSTQELAKGVYYLRIQIGGEVKVEKVVVN